MSLQPALLLALIVEGGVLGLLIFGVSFDFDHETLVSIRG
jgi:hypothetical protein